MTFIVLTRVQVLKLLGSHSILLSSFIVDVEVQSRLRWSFDQMLTSVGDSLKMERIHKLKLK